MVTMGELRRYRFLSLSAIDLFGTIIIATIILLVISKITSVNFDLKNIIIANTIAIVSGMTVHKLLKVNTQLNFVLGLSEKPDVLSFDTPSS